MEFIFLLLRSTTQKSEESSYSETIRKNTKYHRQLLVPWMKRQASPTQRNNRLSYVQPNHRNIFEWRSVELKIRRNHFATSSETSDRNLHFHRSTHVAVDVGDAQRSVYTYIHIYIYPYIYVTKFPKKSKCKTVDHLLGLLRLHLDAVYVCVRAIAMMMLGVSEFVCMSVCMHVPCCACVCNAIFALFMIVM